MHDFKCQVPHLKSHDFSLKSSNLRLGNGCNVTLPIANTVFPPTIGRTFQTTLRLSPILNWFFVRYVDSFVLLHLPIFLIECTMVLELIFNAEELLCPRLV